MAFSSLLFLSGFLPLFVVAYSLAPRALKNGVALLFSILFYAWGAPRFLPVVLALGVIDYFLSHAIARRRGTTGGRVLLTLGVMMHLSTLCYFKYANFFVAQANDLVSLFPGSQPIPWGHIALPIGVSFITFEEISYLVDVHRGDAQPARVLPQYLLFLMLFPHSIAGPIFRWKDLESQLRSRTQSLDMAVAGFTRFSLGLGKKVLIADAVARAADPIFALPASELTPRLAWLGAIAYTLQIYFDFSGYSDMAIGLGKIAGFSFKENFNAPYISASITEFWKRWHISLSTWLRDYLYIPLGGNRSSEGRTLLNVGIVFVLSGFWHGSAWSFVVWGAYHGLWVVLERIPSVKSLQKRLPQTLGVAITLLIVMVGWVFFRAPTLKGAVVMISAMFGAPSPGAKTSLVVGQFLPNRTAAMMAAGVTLALLPLLWKGKDLSLGAKARGDLLARAVAPACLVLSIANLANSKFIPLIYFKF